MSDFYKRLDDKEQQNRLKRLFANRPDNLHEYQGCANDPSMVPESTPPKPAHIEEEYCPGCHFVNRNHLSNCPARKSAHIDTTAPQMIRAEDQGTPKYEYVPWKELAAAMYQFAGAHNAPKKWLDVLSAAAEGDAFSTDGLLPYPGTDEADPICPTPSPIDTTRQKIAELEKRLEGRFHQLADTATRAEIAEARIAELEANYDELKQGYDLRVEDVAHEMDLKETAEARIAELESKLSIEWPEDSECFICKNQTSHLSGNPSQWPLKLPFRGGNGANRIYHTGCVTSAIHAALEAAISQPKADDEEKVK
jgi:hypothetical protein